MSRQFRTVDYEATLKTSVRLEECLPEDHLARFIVDIVAQLDLKPLYARYGNRGGQPYAPEILLGLLFYAYATGVFSSRQNRAGNPRNRRVPVPCGQSLAPDHATIAAFRKDLPARTQSGLFVQILSLAQGNGPAQTRHYQFGQNQNPR